MPCIIIRQNNRISRYIDFDTGINITFTSPFPSKFSKIRFSMLSIPCMYSPNSIFDSFRRNTDFLNHSFYKPVICLFKIRINKRIFATIHSFLFNFFVNPPWLYSPKSHFGSFTYKKWQSAPSDQLDQAGVNALYPF